MLTVKLYVLPGLLIGMVLALTAWFLRSWELGKRPVMFAQATVVAVEEKRAAFELFDGQILNLTVKKHASLRIGDYGRLTYRAGRFLELELREEP